MVRTGHEHPEDLILRRAVVRLRAGVMAVTVGPAEGVGLFLATMILLLGDGEPLAPILSLLGHYFLGYEVSWGGAFLGAAEAGLGGYLFGWVLGRVVNVLVEATELSFVRKCQMLRTIDPLESGNGPPGSR